MATHAAAGTPVADAELPVATGGGRARVLGEAQATVLVFFRLDQPRSRAALKELAECQRALSPRPVRWVALVPDSSPAEAVAAAVREAAFSPPVLVDTGEAFYGALGLSLHPVVVVVDRERRLAAFEPFRSVNFCAVVTAQVRRTLGEISEEEVRSAIDPPAATPSGSAGVARRYRSLAESLLKAGNPAKALESARKSLEQDPSSAEGHALLGTILEALGDCAGALVAFDRALALAPGHAIAQPGRQRCRERG